MQNLHALDLSKNCLSGSIPSCLNNIISLVKKSPNSINSLEEIDTSDGIFIVDKGVTTYFTKKGAIYSYEGIPLSLMTVLDLSINGLTGDILLQVGVLTELQALNLSNNFLIGPIPESFQHLANMESLNLFHNKLTGPISFQLAQLNYLGTFNVAFKNLSGRIPSAGQFSTFNGSSYVGNAGLCGSPIERNCSSDDLSQPHDEEDKEEFSFLDRPIPFYLWELLSFALGFSCFLLVLIFNGKWQLNYFRTIDECIDSTTDGIWKYLLYMKRWL